MPFALLVDRSLDALESSALLHRAGALLCRALLPLVRRDGMLISMGAAPRLLVRLGRSFKHARRLLARAPYDETGSLAPASHQLDSALQTVRDELSELGPLERGLCTHIICLADSKSLDGHSSLLNLAATLNSLATPATLHVLAITPAGAEAAWLASETHAWLGALCAGFGGGELLVLPSAGAPDALGRLVQERLVARHLSPAQLSLSVGALGGSALRARVGLHPDPCVLQHAAYRAAGLPLPVALEICGFVPAHAVCAPPALARHVLLAGASVVARLLDDGEASGGSDPEGGEDGDDDGAGAGGGGGGDDDSGSGSEREAAALGSRAEPGDRAVMSLVHAALSAEALVAVARMVGAAAGAATGAARGEAWQFALIVASGGGGGGDAAAAALTLIVLPREAVLPQLAPTPLALLRTHATDGSVSLEHVGRFMSYSRGALGASAADVPLGGRATLLAELRAFGALLARLLGGGAGAPADEAASLALAAAVRRLERVAALYRCAEWRQAAGDLVAQVTALPDTAARAGPLLMRALGDACKALAR